MLAFLLNHGIVNRGAKWEISREGRGALILGGLGEFFQIWSLIRAFSEQLRGGAGFARGGRQTILGCQGGAPAPAPPPFCASEWDPMFRFHAILSDFEP